MSDLRCPMCGKTNSSDQVSCKYCQARLKPLLIDSEPLKSSSDSGSIAPDKDSTSLDMPHDASSELPSWLDSLRSTAPAETGSEPFLDWMADPSAPGSDAAPEDDIPDWLKNLGGESSKAEQRLFGVDEIDAKQKQEEGPDWLAGMRDASSQSLEDQFASGEQENQFSEDDQDWLPRIESAPAPVSTGDESARMPFEVETPGEDALAGDSIGPSEESIPQDDAESIPDWLAGPPVAAVASDASDNTLEADIPNEIQPAAVGSSLNAFFHDTNAPSDDEMSPAWLDEFVAAGTMAAVVDNKPSIPAEEVPDWLAGYNETAIPAENLPSNLAKETEAVSLDWLEDERKTLDTETEQSQAEPENAEPGMAPFADDADSQPFMSGEIPDWLGKESEVVIPLEAQATPGEAGEDLARADLPSWLESMRPIEAAALSTPVAESSDKQLEGTGPLAGLRSVLPSEFELGARSAPAAYTVTLQVSDTHKTHASIIDELIKSEGEAGNLPGRRALGPQQYLLIGIFAILLIAIIWPILSSNQAVALPPSNTEVLEASNAIGTLPGAAPVLLAVDYEPGLSGEMEATASAVLDHLMLKGAYLALVSTAPTGPAQAERLVQGVNERGEHTYQGNNMYTNLGYIPGGIVGIRSFAESPRQIMPFSLDGTDVWNAGPLAGILNISDFAMLLVITENPSTARSWIEQVKPVLGDKPLLMVVSAQVEPVVRPYFEGEPRMIQGIVAGLPGGASYENMIGRSNLARKYWDAYSYGISLIALLLLVGGVVSVVIHYVRERKAGGATG